MNFEDAIVYLKSGAKIYRKAWGESPKQLYIAVVQDGVPRNTIHFSSPLGSEGVWIPSNHDILSNDWVATDKQDIGRKDIGEILGA